MLFHHHTLSCVNPTQGFSANQLPKMDVENYTFEVRFGYIYLATDMVGLRHL
jgi:hypothetical protein